MTRSTRGHERSVLNTRRGIDMALFDRVLDELLVKLLDRSTDPIAKVVPGSPRGLVASPEPLHGFVQPSFLVPHGWRLPALEILIQDHLQQRQRIKRRVPNTAIKLIDLLAVELIDLAFDDARDIIGC